MEVLHQTAIDIPRGYVDFFHDDGPDFVHLRNLYNAFALENRNTSKRMGGFSSQDDKVASPLQAADMIANSVMGSHTQLEQGIHVNPLTVDFLPKSNIFEWSRSQAMQSCVTN